MEFKKYQHVCRLGTQETDGILNGECFIFPKIDGTNSSVWMDENGYIRAGSRNRVLDLDDDNQNFYNSILEREFETGCFKEYFTEHPNHILYGEWLVKHSLKTYKDSAWRRFYIFDVCEINDINNGDEEDLKYLSYDEYSEYLDKHNLTYIPPLLIKENPNEDDISYCVNNNKYLIQKDEGCGEGIVIKNYGYRNKYKRIVWAKVLHDEFTNRGNKVRGSLATIGKEVELDIIERFVTPNFVNKEYWKIINDLDIKEEDISDNRKKIIPMLISKVWYELINEEIYNIIKKMKNPTINFKILNNLVINKIKEVKVDLFV